MIRIVAVDDDPSFTEMLYVYLNELGGFRISTYNSPNEALSHIHEENPDAVITDYSMEEMDGITLLSTFKEIIPGLPCLLLTGQNDQEIIIRAFSAGADFIEFKGGDPSRLFVEIAQKITNAVEKYRARRESETGKKNRELMMNAQRFLMERLWKATTKNEAADATLLTIESLTGSTTGSIHLVNPETGTYDLAISHNLPTDLIRQFTYGDIPEVISSNKPLFFESGTGDGESFPITGGQVPVRASGEVIGILSFIMDTPVPLHPIVKDTIELLANQLGHSLTRLQSEEQIKHREEELSELYAAMQELVLVIDMDGTILNVNPAAARALEWGEDELSGVPVQTVYPAELMDEIILQFLSLTGTGVSVRNSFPLLNRSGKQIPVETRGSVGTWGGRSVLFCISRDISERLEAERNLHEYYERMNAILASSTAQIYLKDRDMKYVMANEVFCSFVNTDPAFIAGKTDDDFFPPGIAAKRHDGDLYVMNEDTPVYNVEEEIETREKEPVWLATSKVPVHDQSGEVTGLVGTTIVISDLVRTREELIHRDRILSAVSTVAQDLVRGNEWEPIIPACLELLGAASQMDIVFFASLNPGTESHMNPYYQEWNNQWIPPEESDGYTFFRRFLPGLTPFLQNRPFYQANRSSLSALCTDIKDIWYPESLLLFPVFSYNILWGVLGFISRDRDPLWSIAEIESLTMAADLIGSAISRYQTEELFHKPVEHSLVGIYLLQNDQFVYTNPRLSDILGHPRDILKNTPITAYVHPEDVVMVEKHHLRVIENPQTAVDYEFRAITGDGMIITLENLISGFMYLGKPAVIGSIMDVTKRKRAEEELMQSLHEKDILLREIHHRVKNNMQIIVSMLRMQAKLIEDPAIYAILQESKNRILSMAMIHEKLYRTDNLVSINLLEYTLSLASTLISDFSPDESLIDLDIVCDPSIEMTIDVGIPLGLILNELITNSFKHGFSPGKRGTIGVRVLPDGAGGMDIIYRDSGKGLPPGFNPDMQDSLGMQIISNLIFQLEGEIIFSSENGATVSMKIPVHEGFTGGGDIHAPGE